MSHQARRIILDGDPGADDFLAWLAACGSAEFEIQGITTVFGNVGVEQTTSNALRFREFVGRPIPVFKGAGCPIGRTEPEKDNAHGLSGLGAVLLPDPEVEVEDEGAVSFILRTLRASAGNPPGQRITVFATGPLTNICEAFDRAPEIAGQIDELIVMGGAFEKQGRKGAERIGNITEFAEFNWYSDPVAADRVMNSGIRCTVLPLDATRELVSSEPRIRRLASGLVQAGVDDAKIEVVAELLRSARDLDMAKFGVDGAFLHDPSTILYALAPECFSSVRGRVHVIAGSHIKANGQAILSDDTVGPTATVLTGIVPGSPDMLFDMLTKRMVLSLQ